MEETLTISAVAGAVAPILTAVLARFDWPGNAKRWVGLSVAALLSALGFLMIAQPETGQAAAAGVLAAIGVMQAVYTGLKKPLDSLSIATTKKTHGAEPIEPAEFVLFGEPPSSDGAGPAVIDKFPK